MSEYSAFAELGIAGIVAGGAFFMIRYFMATVQRKDEEVMKTVSKITELRETIVDLKASITELTKEMTRK